MPEGFIRKADSSGSVHLRGEHVRPLLAVLFAEAAEATRQHARFALMYEALPANESADVLAYVRKMRDHWDARHGAYMALAECLAGRSYPLSDIRRAEGSSYLKEAERILNKRGQHDEG